MVILRGSVSSQERPSKHARLLTMTLSNQRLDCQCRLEPAKSHLGNGSCTRPCRASQQLGPTASLTVRMGEFSECDNKP